MRTHVIPAVAALLTAAVMLYQGSGGDPVLCEAPAVALGEIAGFASEPQEPGEAERTVLPADTRIEKRRYTRPDGLEYFVTVVVGGRSKSSVHRPELCLPSQGFLMASPRTLAVDGTDWRVMDLARRDARPMGFAYTFFNQAGFRTSSHLSRIFRDVWDRSVLGRIDRWVMVTVHSSVAGDDRRTAAFLRKLKGVVCR